MRRHASRIVVALGLAGFAFVTLPGCGGGGDAVTQTTQSVEEKQSVSTYEENIAKNKAAATPKKK